MRHLGKDLLGVGHPPKFVEHPGECRQRGDLQLGVVLDHRDIRLGDFQGALDVLLLRQLRKHERQGVGGDEVPRRLRVGLTEELRGRFEVTGDAGDRAIDDPRLEVLRIEIERLAPVLPGGGGVAVGEKPVGRAEADPGILWGGLDRGFNELTGLVDLLPLIVETRQEHFLARQFPIEIMRFTEGRERLVGLLELEVSAPQTLLGAGAVGIDFDPLLDLGEGRLPLTAGLVHRGLAGVAADLEVALPLGVGVELRGQFLRPVEEHRSISDHPLLEGEIA